MRGGRIGHGSRTNPADPSAFVVPGLNPDSISTRRTCQASFRVAETPAVAHREEGGGGLLCQRHTRQQITQILGSALPETHTPTPPLSISATRPWWAKSRAGQDFTKESLLGNPPNFEFWLGFTKESLRGILQIQNFGLDLLRNP